MLFKLQLDHCLYFVPDILLLRYKELLNCVICVRILYTAVYQNLIGMSVFISKCSV